MRLRRIVSEGLAHFSYLIGEGRTAVVIDPRLDCQAYVDEAAAAGMRISHILETHRNEDYVVGSLELATRTGAQIWHADSELEYKYGQAAQPGQAWDIAGHKLEALATPGHTPGSMSYLLREASGDPWIVFTGDTLFAGDVGRVDLPGVERIDEMANAQCDSIFGRLIPLGDEVILCPAHGAGSACGSQITDRPWTTIGFERKHNPVLQYRKRADFVRRIGVELERPPYFRRMEDMNLTGTSMPMFPLPTALPPRDFAEAAKEAQVLDTRSEYSFGAALVPNALSIWLDGVAGFAGWFLSYDKPILLAGEPNEAALAVSLLARMGYNQVAGFLSGGMHDWVYEGLPVDSIDTLSVQALCRLIDEMGQPWILDVRSDAELADYRIPGAHHIHITQLPGQMAQVPRDRPVYIFCGSGRRSMIAASLMKRAGWSDLHVVLGGTAGWNAISCPLEGAASERGIG